MSKRCKRASSDSFRDATSAADDVDEINWSLCVLCQECTDAPLVCPANSTRKDVGAGYETLDENLTGFLELGVNPVPVDISRLNEGDGIATTLSRNGASWHANCRLRSSTSRLARSQAISDASTKTEEAGGRYTRAQGTSKDMGSKCFLCDEPGTYCNPLHEAMTRKITQRVKQCALKLQDQKLIAQLSVGDLRAQDATYHSKCLVKLYNASCRKIEGENAASKDGLSYGIALVEVIGYINDMRFSDECAVQVFRLADLVQLYTNRLRELQVDVTGRVHSTDLKKRILDNVCGLREYKQGRDIFLTFDDDIGALLSEAALDECDDEAVCLAKAAQIVRRDMLEMKAKFDGTFPENCQEDAVPSSLIALVGMILDGTNIANRNDEKARQATVSVAQLLQFNSQLRRRPTSSNSAYHIKDRETPLPIYLGLMVHGQTRKRELVDTLFSLGLSISYDTVLDISKCLATSACEQYKADDVVCPLTLQKCLFTTAAVDNIDYNPSATTAHDAFHGTGISLFQHRPTGSAGVQRQTATFNGLSSKKAIIPLPEFYTNLKPVTVMNKTPSIPFLRGSRQADDQLAKKAVEEERNWQRNTLKLIVNEHQSIEHPISWSAFHADNQTAKEVGVTITSLLPLFPDDSKSVAMIRHSMDVVKRAVNFLNPGQVPVVTVDQPLYAIAKLIQWNWPATYGEQNFVIVLGGLHTEIAALSRCTSRKCKEVYATCVEKVICNRTHLDVSALAPCTHEEADTRMFVHVQDAFNRGHRRMMLRTVDTDVVVLAVSTAAILVSAEIWIAFGTGNNMRYISAHDIATALGDEKAQGLPMLHAFTGCDTVSSFAGRGKKTAFDIWKTFDDVTPVFSTLFSNPASFNNDKMCVLETYVVLLYDRTSTDTSVDVARRRLFTCKGRSIDAIPPTSASLLQHTKRAIYQGGHIWGQSLVRVPDVPTPELWGWKQSALQGWEPNWTLLPEAAATCAEFIRCGCKKGCTGLCKCVKADLKCTSSCNCSGTCDHNDTYEL